MAASWADPATEIHAAIERLRADMKAQAVLELDALTAEQRALDAADSARALVLRCRDNRAEDLAEIDRLLEELPRPREGA